MNKYTVVLMTCMLIFADQLYGQCGHTETGNVAGIGFGDIDGELIVTSEFNATGSFSYLCTVEGVLVDLLEVEPGDSPAGAVAIESGNIVVSDPGGFTPFGQNVIHRFNSSGNYLGTVLPDNDFIFSFGNRVDIKNGQVISIGTDFIDSFLYVHDFATGNQLKRLTIKNTLYSPYTVSMTTDGDFAAVQFDSNGDIVIFNLQTGMQVATLKDGPFDTGNPMAMSDGVLAIVERVDNETDLFDAATGNLIKTVTLPNPNWSNIQTIAFAGSRKLVVLVDDDDPLSNNDEIIVAYDWQNESVGTVIESVTNQSGFIRMAASVNRVMGLTSFPNELLIYNICNQIVFGDINQDCEISLLDIAPFVELIINLQYQEAGDLNNDGVVDLLDVPPFVNLLTGV